MEICSGEMLWAWLPFSPKLAPVYEWPLHALGSQEQT